jgi:hypothetical protein
MGRAYTLDLIIAASTILALAARPRPAAWTERSGRLLGHPAASLAIVTGLIYLNQVLFTVYILRVRHGDPSFIARYLPSGWFTLARGGAIAALARHFPAPGLLAPTVLRVQAFLELPFVIFGYLTACRWFGVFNQARRLVWPASIAWTATFCLIEWSLHNPFTTDDLIIRVISGLMVPLWAARLTPASDTTGDTTRDGTPADLLVSALSVAALGGLVLVVYDTALLYNLGKLGTELPVAGLAAAVLLAARLTAARLRRPAPGRAAGRGPDSIASSFGWFLVLFFVPALPVRYGIDFGTRAVAALAGLIVMAAACALGVRDAFARSPGPAGRWLAQMSVTAIAGLAAALPVAALSAGYPETRLLLGAATFFTVAVLVCAMLDHRAVAADPGDEPRLVMTNLIVVGGGIVGAACAYTATTLGAEVVLVDAALAGRATAAGAGIICRGSRSTRFARRGCL